MSNKRKGDFTDSDDLIIKQSRQTITSVEVEEEKRSSLLNTLHISNDVSSENSIIRNNTSLDNESEESILPNERTANKSSVGELTATNCKADKIRVEQIYIPFTTVNIISINGNINSSNSEICSLTEIKTEQPITPSPLNSTYEENAGKSNTNDLNRVQCQLDEISIEETAIRNDVEDGTDITQEHNTSGNDSAAVKVEETEIASGSIKKSIENVQDPIAHISIFVSISQRKNYEKDADDSEKYIDTVNSINRYVKDGLYCIEYFPTYENYIYITSCYEHRVIVSRAWKTLPRSMVTVKTLKGHKGGVFAVRPIYKGVRIGPIEVTTNARLNRNCYAWKMANGRLYYNPRMSFSNWTLFVNYTRNKQEQNLTISQHEGVLFFRTVKTINVNEELLVNYDNILTVKMNENVEMCVPYVEKTIAKVYICRLCYLGFKSERNLNDHVCKAAENIPESELWECTVCNSFICEKKYKAYHAELCTNKTTATFLTSLASKKCLEDRQFDINVVKESIFTNANRFNSGESSSSGLKQLERDDSCREKASNNCDRTYIDKVNSLNPYLSSTNGLYHVESNSFYNHFIHIISNRCDFDANVEGSCRAWKTLPRSCLSIKALEDYKGGVFAERSIPNGIRIGPIEGAISKKLRDCCGWKLKNGRLLFVEQLLHSNWARFVNYTKDKDEQNLTISQHLGLLYFRTVKDIEIGQELLVNYDNILAINSEEEEYCVPYIEKKFGNIYTCDECNLVFKDAILFGIHVCNKPINILDEDLWVCSHCNSFVCELRYAKWHKKNCELDRKQKELENEENSGNCSKNVVKLDCSFTHISSINIQPGTKSRVGLTLPATVLSLSEHGNGGVFAIEKITEGVTMGPYEGILGKRLSNKYGYLFQNGNFKAKSECDANWLGAVKVTSSTNALNLIPFQHDGELYFEVVKQIDIGQELLLFLNSEILEMFGNTYCVPPVRETLPFYRHCECMLGFNSEDSLVIHQLTCLGPDHAPKRLHEASCTHYSKCQYCNVFVCGCKNKLLNHEKQCFWNTIRDQPPKDKVVGEDDSYIEKVNSLNPSIDSPDGLYYVEDNALYEDFVHIASSNISDCESFREINFRAWKTLPRSCLSIRTLKDHKGGVFATRLISKGVRMGPIEGAISKTLKECHGWRLEKNGRLAYVQQILYSNWTRFVNYTQDKDKQNLTLTQHMGLMYFRTLKDIQDGQELLVNYDNILTINWNEQEYCVPFIEKKFGNNITCDQCDLVFKDSFCFGFHVCSKPPDVLDKDLWACNACNLFMCEEKYKGFHQHHCHGFVRRNMNLNDALVEDISLSRSKKLYYTHISCASIPPGTKSRAWLTLPGTLLASTMDGKKGVFAMDNIVKGTTMGPYEGIIETQMSDKYGYLFEDGNLKATHEFNTNWLAAVNVISSESESEFNLITFQHDGHLYFETVKTIDVGQELLVYLNSVILEMDGKTYYVPPVRKTLPTHHRCACMLSFGNENTLVIHQLTCIGRGYTLKRLHQSICTNVSKCQHCNSLVCKCDQNLVYHEKQCLKIISRKNNCTNQSEKREDNVNYQCKQISQYLSKIRMSSDKKYYKCGQCDFKGVTVDMVYEHLPDHAKWKTIRKPNGLIAYYMCKYCKKCILTAFDLKGHYEKHVKELPYACRFCYFRSARKDQMKIHLDTGHINGWIKDADMTQGIELSLSSALNDNFIESSDSEAEPFSGEQNNTNEQEEDIISDSDLIDSTSEIYGKFINTSSESVAEKLNSTNPYIEAVGGMYYIESDSSYNDFVYVSCRYKNPGHSYHKPWKMLPRSVLTVKTLENHKGGVFATRRIPRGVRLGPIEGVVNEKVNICYAWKLDDYGKLFYYPLRHSSWARFVNYTPNINARNLTITQREGLLYFRTVKDIEVNQELLVNHNNILTIVLRRREVCIPYIENEHWNTIICDRCDLGFKSEADLKNHICNQPLSVSDAELWSCKKCSAFVCEDMYKKNHMLNCQKKEFGDTSEEPHDFATTFAINLRNISTTLMHISSEDLPLGSPNRREKTLPNQLLALKSGVIALMKIPKGVTIGPYDGLIKTKLLDKYGFVFRSGNLVKIKNLNNLNWLSYVNVTSSLNEMNLTTLQYNGQLFFETVKDIDIYEELFVLLNSEVCDINGKTYYVPSVRNEMTTPYLCTCLSGFKNEESLLIHKLMCRPPKLPISELLRCEYCDVFMCQERKAMADHEKQCSEDIIKGVMNTKKIILHIDEIDGPEDVAIKEQIKKKTAPVKINRNGRGKKKKKICNDTASNCRDLIITKENIHSNVSDEAENSVDEATNEQLKEEANLDETNRKADEECEEQQEPEECKICNKEFSRLNLHMKITHMTPDQFYKCSICSFKSLKVNLVYEHVKGHEKWEITRKPNSSTAIYKCKLCENKFSAVHNSTLSEGPAALQFHLKDHFLKHMIALPYSCKFCYYRGDLETLMESHILINHTEGWPEDEDKRTEIKLSLSASTTYREIDQYMCKICNEYSIYLGMHIKRKHMINKLFKCPECSYKINELSKLQSHMQSTHKKIEIVTDKQPSDVEDTTNAGNSNEKEFLCESMKSIQREPCRYCDTDCEDLEMHLKHDHKVTKKIIHCPNCNFISDKNEDLAVHVTYSCKQTSESLGKHCYTDSDLTKCEADTNVEMAEDTADGCTNIDSTEDNTDSKAVNVNNLKNKLFYCPFCLCNYKFAYHLKSHVRGQHVINVDINGMEVYISTKHVREKIPCPICHREFKNLKSHMTRIH